MTFWSLSIGRAELRDEVFCDRDFSDQIKPKRGDCQRKHKTQVFLTPTVDHYRTRLTHNLEAAPFPTNLHLG